MLIIAGSDSSGGAGIQADVKTVTMLGGYAATAITALTAQNTLGVIGIEPVNADFVALQMDAVLTDIGADAIKIGMLASAAITKSVAATCRRLAPAVPIVLDPVMVAKGGARLLEPAAERALVGELLPMAALLTPNAPEAEALTGEPVTDEAGLLRVASKLLLFGPSAVLLKGGHLPGDRVVDYLVTADGTVERFESPRILTTSTHGTGCTLSAAITAGLALGHPLDAAVSDGLDFVRRAMLAAPGLGQGHGPLNHRVPITGAISG